jgi:hypothetical protein
MDTMTEKKMPRMSGFLAAFLMLATWIGAICLMVMHGPAEDTMPDAWFASGLAWIILSSLAFNGFFIVQPNLAKAFVFFGRYAGTGAEPGFWFTNPLCTRRKLPLRMRNFTSQTIKVNDAGGNPIEIAAVVLWRATDTAKALFAVDSYENYVVIQSETGVRNRASHYPYDTADAAQESLRSSPDGITEALRRQQAAAIIAARRLIVDGAVGMVQMALVSESEAQPVINTGSLYT